MINLGFKNRRLSGVYRDQRRVTIEANLPRQANVRIATYVKACMFSIARASFKEPQHSIA